MKYEELLRNKNFVNFKNNDLITMTFGELLILHQIGKLDLNHPTQRQAVWDEAKANKMIESIIQGFPFEPIYMVKNKQGYSIIDGKQRISTMFLFLGISFDDLRINFGKSKKKDEPISIEFCLKEDYLDEDLWIELNKLKENENQEINFNFLVQKIEGFYKIFSNVTFPVYILNDQNREIGEETNVYELFRKLNSSGSIIETGEEIKARIYEIVSLSKSKIQNEFSKIENVSELIKLFSKIISGNHIRFYREKEWFFFIKLFWNIKKYDEILKSTLDSVQIEDEVDEFVKKISFKMLNDYFTEFKKINEIINKAKNKFCKENNQSSIFNKTGTDAAPINGFISGIYVGVYYLLYSENNNSIFKENLIIERVIKLVKLIREILDLGNDFWKFNYSENKDENFEKRSLLRKFSREPEKVKLYSFLGKKVIVEGIEDYDNIRNDIFEEFFKNELGKWNKQ